MYYQTAYRKTWRRQRQRGYLSREQVLVISDLQNCFRSFVLFKMSINFIARNIDWTFHVVQPSFVLSKSSQSHLICIWICLYGNVRIWIVRGTAEQHAAHSLTVTAKILKGGIPTVFGES